MTSQERHEARYQRRKAKRQQRKQARCDALGPVDKVFSYRKMFYYGRKCCNGVRWKQSVQNFELHLFSGTAKRRREVLDGTWTPKKCTHFTLCERGKVRPIDGPILSAIKPASFAGIMGACIDAFKITLPKRGGHRKPLPACGQGRQTQQRNGPNGASRWAHMTHTTPGTRFPTMKSIGSAPQAGMCGNPVCMVGRK